MIHLGKCVHFNNKGTTRKQDSVADLISSTYDFATTYQLFAEWYGKKRDLCLHFARYKQYDLVRIIKDADREEVCKIFNL